MTTPEQDYENDVWITLQKIKRYDLETLKNQPIEFILNHVISTGWPSYRQEAQILRKLEESRVIEFVNKNSQDGGWIFARNHILINLIKPEFDEIYKKYEKSYSDDLSESKIVDKPKGSEKINLKDVSINIVIADLKSLYTEIEQEKDHVHLFMKIANYGKYILENQATTDILSPLYLESKNDVQPYIKTSEIFISEWKDYGKDLLEQLIIAGIEENPDNPLDDNANRLRIGLMKTEERSLWEFDLDYLFTPYQFLVWKFNEVGKSDLLVPKHFNSLESTTLNIHPVYQIAKNEWNKFKYVREGSVWWAHYQICRLAAGVLGLTQREDYFKDDNVIDSFYKYEFDELAKGNLSRTPIVLHYDKYKTWIQRLNNYILPRLESVSITQNSTESSPDGIKTVSISIKKSPTKREMAKEVSKLKKICHLGKKEGKLLEILSTFELVKTKGLKEEIPTNDYIHLKKALQKKIGKYWKIKTIKSRGLNLDSFYQLTPLTNAKIG